MINNFDAQHYASLYCQYDKKSGNRNWKELLEQNTVETIDLVIAKNARDCSTKRGRSSKNHLLWFPFGSTINGRKSG